MPEAEALASQQVEIEACCEGYIKRMLPQVEKVSWAVSVHIPVDFDYSSIDGMRLEAREKLSHIRPETVVHAAAISGVPRADIAILTVHVEPARGKKFKGEDSNVL